MNEETLAPFMWGAGKSYASKSINDLEVDETVHSIIVGPSGNGQSIIELVQQVREENPSLDEEGVMKMVRDRYRAQSILGSSMANNNGDVDYEESFKVICEKLRKVGGSLMIQTVSMEDYKPDVKQLLNLRKTNAHLLKKKEPKFYETLNKKRKGFG